MIFAQGRKRLTTRFSERITVDKRRISVFDHQDGGQKCRSTVAWLIAILMLVIQTCNVVLASSDRVQVTFTLQVNLADHGYVLAHTYTCHTYLLA
jgi:hypothetical protein